MSFRSSSVALTSRRLSLALADVLTSAPLFLVRPLYGHYPHASRFARLSNGRSAKYCVRQEEAIICDRGDDSSLLDWLTAQNCRLPTCEEPSHNRSEERRGGKEGRYRWSPHN